MKERRNYLIAVGGLAGLAGCASSDPESEEEEEESPEEEEEHQPIELVESWTFESENTISSVPASDGDSVFAYSDDNRIYCIDLSSGDELWNFQFDDLPVSTYTPTVGDDHVFTTYDSGSRSVYALDKSDGSIIWEQDDLRRAHVFTENGLFTSYGGIKSIDPESGEIEWEYEASFYGSPPVADNNYVIGVGSTEIYAVDQADGGEQWNHQPPGDISSESLNILDDFAVFSADDERIHLLDIETGDVERQISTDGRAEVSVIDGDLYYQDGNGLHLYDYSIDEDLWTTTERPAGRGNLPNQYANGELIVAASLGGVVHVDRDSGEVSELLDAELPTNVGHAVASDHILIPDDNRSLHAYTIDF
ncbi:PQQ-binding-like beta-propeller repeat protein [Halorubrum tibetense]|uniref:PQQ-binding-like beta-propeller repeat protein n=1 Tax=Halorubrum tibetense TaxID=175631 RepID=A0ABD5S6B5_9EURY